MLQAILVSFFAQEIHLKFFRILRFSKCLYLQLWVIFNHLLVKVPCDSLHKSYLLELWKSKLKEWNLTLWTREKWKNIFISRTANRSAKRTNIWAPLPWWCLVYERHFNLWLLMLQVIWGVTILLLQLSSLFKQTVFYLEVTVTVHIKISC